MIKDSNTATFDFASMKLFVYNSRLCNKLNQVLKAYDGGAYFFLAGEEAVFKVPHIKLVEVWQTVESFK